jgi:DNA (cytosine-5)-methyltransferase 1
MTELELLSRGAQVCSQVARSDDPTAISLFTGAGGLDLGLAAAQWQILAQVEMDCDSVETLRYEAEDRGDETLVVPMRIEDVPPRDLRRTLGLRKGELTLLAGGPPCQPFTTSGLRRSINDTRASSLFPQYLEFVREFSPQALLIENVDGLLSAALKHRRLVDRGPKHPPLRPEEQKASFLKWLLENLAGLGYSLAWGVAEAADYGVPQLRQRAVITGVKGIRPCYLPAPTHGGENRPPHCTLSDALGDLTELGAVQPLSERKKEVYRLIPPGGNWRDLPDKIQQSTMGRAYYAAGGRSGWWRRLDWGAPAPTILGMPDHSSTALVHPDELRCLSVNECAAIQSFPAGTRFAGNSRSQYQQIGNAVPPLLGARLGKALLDHLEGEHQDTPPPPRWRKSSANRRIGTHGWAVPTRKGTRYHLNVAVRADHVWAQLDESELLG